MPERGFNTEYWADPFVESLPMEGKLLYAYLWTNPHCNQAGLYVISLERIAYETKLPLENLSSLLTSLEPKVKWYPDDSLIWVKNFIKRQSKSPKFLVAAAKSLSSIHNNGAIEELLKYNLQKYSISIPYPYSTNTVAIPSSAAASASSSSVSNNKRGVVRGEENLAAITKVYEENIGIITPMVAEKLKDIAERYPPGWFKDAVAEAVEANVRKLSYIESILERWEREGYKAPRGKGGRSDGEAKQASRTGRGGDQSPTHEQYLRSLSHTRRSAK